MQIYDANYSPQSLFKQLPQCHQNLAAKQMMNYAVHLWKCWIVTTNDTSRVKILAHHFRFNFFFCITICVFFFEHCAVSCVSTRSHRAGDEPSEGLKSGPTAMKPFLVVFCLLGSVANEATLCNVSASDFHLKGDFLIGGLFQIHHVSSPANQDRPEVIDCST